MYRSKKNRENEKMAKFAIECPVCGKYAEGRTGFFARKKINCSCGNVIDVRTDKLAVRDRNKCYCFGMYAGQKLG